MSHTVFHKTYKKTGIFISVITGGYGGGLAPFEVLIEKDNEPLVLTCGILKPSLSSEGWLTLGAVQEVIDYLDIKKSHFVGISLGTVLIRNLAEKYPERVSSMVMGGAIMRLDMRFRLLMIFGNMFKSLVPYIWLYRLFTFAIMPDSNHKESRLLFIREAKKLYQKEFVRWYKMGSEISPLLRFFRTMDVKIPTLYVMGGEDYLFLPSVKKMIRKQTSSSLLTIEHCGHVVNVEQPKLFNDFVIGYVTEISR